MAQEQAPLSAESFATTIRPLLTEYCGKCHSTERHKGDLDLEQFTSLEIVRQHPDVWQLVVEQVGSGEMPPAEKPQPEPAQRQQLLGLLRAMLDELARANAGDPGPVVLRRLSNAEYTYTIRDLTGVDSLAPMREFPADGAAGEGFTNVGNALVVSPMLLEKYLEAARGIAAHAVLLPDGIGFSSGTDRREWTEECLARIGAFHDRFTDAEGGSQVNVQGIVFATNGGGRLPLVKYLTASLLLRDAAADAAAVAALARDRGLSAKYLGILLAALQANEPSPLLDPVRARWRAAGPADVEALVAQIASWQQVLFRFQSVGHIGKVGGPKAWLEPVDPLVLRQEFRVPLSPTAGKTSVELQLRATNAIAGDTDDVVVWQQPRLRLPGGPDLPLRAVENAAAALAASRARGIAAAERCLLAAAAIQATPEPAAAVAQRYGVEPDLLDRWIDYLGIGDGGALPALAYLADPIHDVSGHAFVDGLGRAGMPCLLTNASDGSVRVPGLIEPHRVAVHPSPEAAVVVGWLSPVAAVVAVRATIQHAHPDCGNGVVWALDVQRGTRRWRHAAGATQGSTVVAPGPIVDLCVQPGDLVSLRIGAGAGNHSCDLTMVDLAIVPNDASARQWHLSADVADDVLAGNPHADRQGNAGVWHFFLEPEAMGTNVAAAIPTGSLLARWLATNDPEQRRVLGIALHELLTAATPAGGGADAALHRQLLAVDGPLCGGWAAFFEATGAPGEPDELRPQAPHVLQFPIPAELAAGAEFVTTAVIAVPAERTGGGVRLAVTTDASPDATDPFASGPIVASDHAATRARLARAFEQFRRLFPPALCYRKIVPVDEAVTLTLFHREDEHLVRLILDDAEAAELDRLWRELHFVSQDALLMVDVFEQLYQYVTQDGDPKLFEPLREPIRQRAAVFRQELAAAEPAHVDSVLGFAARAWRRPLTDAEQAALRTFYSRLRADELPHDAAIRLLLTRVLVSPAFLYHGEEPQPGTGSSPVNDWELASRLSYFLWSSVPDDELRALAAAGRLREPGVLAGQAHRMVQDARVRALATEFGCGWLHLQGFDELDEKSERHFPTFVGLRGAMHEEAIRFFTDFFQRDASILDLLDADHVFVNGALAAHYGLDGVVGDEWRRVDGARQFGRGGVLGLAATLSKQSGASRTSPILRGNWVCEVLLGEKLPRPPKDVPRLPEDEAAADLTMRELTARHSSDPKCAHCHDRMDAFGFALEEFDGIGRRRQTDLGGRPIDARAETRDGARFEGIAGLRDHLLGQRREEFVRQFCRKLLGYSLGRGVLLTDEPLLAELRAVLAVDGHRVGRAIDLIVTSRQFREIRGRDAAGR